MPSSRHLDAAPPQLARTRTDTHRGSGLVLLMWIRILRVPAGSRSSHSSMPSGAALRQMADVARALAGDAQANHFIVGPERAVHQHARCRLHGLPQPLVDARRNPARKPPMRPLARSSMTSADVVARHRGLAVGRVRRRLARHGQRAPSHARHRVDRRTRASRSMRRRSTPQKWPSTLNIGLPRVRSGIGAVGAPDRPGARRFAQHVKSGGVVHLPVDQHDRADRRVAKRPVRLQLRGSPAVARRISGDAFTSTQRGRIQPVTAIEDCVRAGALKVPARTPGAVGAVAVPLRKAAAGGRPQYANFHGGT